MFLERPDGGSILMGANALNQAAFLQRHKQPVGGGFVHAGSSDQLTQPQRLSGNLKCLQQVASSEHSFNQVAVLGPGRIRHEGLGACSKNRIPRPKPLSIPVRNVTIWLLTGNVRLEALNAVPRS